MQALISIRVHVCTQSCTSRVDNIVTSASLLLEFALEQFCNYCRRCTIHCRSAHDVKICRLEPVALDLKTSLFSFISTAISRNSFDLLNPNLTCVSF